MHDNVHDLFTEDLSDEAAYYLCNFFYDLALAFESSHLGEIMRHQKSQVECKFPVATGCSTLCSHLFCVLLKEAMKR